VGAGAALAAGKPRPPFDEVVAYQTPSRADLQLAVRTGNQWYRYSLGNSHDLGNDNEHCGRTEYKAITFP
jgi:hypothetical protein